MSTVTPSSPKPLMAAVASDPRRWESFLLYQAGFSFPEISEKTGIPETTLRQWSARQKWPDLRSELEAKREERRPKAEMPLAKAFTPESRDEIVKRFEQRMNNVADKTSEFLEGVAMESPAALLEVAQKAEALDKMNRRTLKLDAEEQGEKGHISLTFLTGNPTQMVRLIEQPKKELEEA